VPPAIPRPPEQGASDVSDTELFTMEEEEVVVMTSPQQQQQQQQQAAEDIRASSSASSSLTVESTAVVAKAEGIFFNSRIFAEMEIVAKVNHEKLTSRYL
jgi:hypothetical protein